MRTLVVLVLLALPLSLMAAKPPTEIVLKSEQPVMAVGHTLCAVNNNSDRIIQFAIRQCYHEVSDIWLDTESACEEDAFDLYPGVFISNTFGSPHGWAIHSCEMRYMGKPGDLETSFCSGLMCSNVTIEGALQ